MVYFGAAPCHTSAVVSHESETGLASTYCIWTGAQARDLRRQPFYLCSWIRKRSRRRHSYCIHLCQVGGSEMHIGSGKSHPCGKFWECRKRRPYAGWIGAWAFPDQKRNVISIHSTFWCANKNPASEATRLQWNIRKVCELFQTLASGTAVSSSGMSSASKTGCSSSRSSSFNVWPAQVSQSKPSLEKTWGTLMHRITCFYLCALEALLIPSQVSESRRAAKRVNDKFQHSFYLHRHGLFLLLFCFWGIKRILSGGFDHKVWENKEKQTIP